MAVLPLTQPLLHVNKTVIYFTSYSHRADGILAARRSGKQKISFITEGEEGRW
jgi:hypothetical protein